MAGIKIATEEHPQHMAGCWGGSGEQSLPEQGRSPILSLCCARLICLVRSWFPIFVGRDMWGANSKAGYIQFHRSLLSLCMSCIAPVLDDQCAVLVLNES